MAIKKFFLSKIEEKLEKYVLFGGLILGAISISIFWTLMVIRLKMTSIKNPPFREGLGLNWFQFSSTNLFLRTSKLISFDITNHTSYEQLFYD